jgi:hypothetical protein
MPPLKTEAGAPAIRKLGDPLFSPVQPRPEVPPSADDAGSALRDVRLTGIVIGPDRRIAIFTVTGNNPRVLSEGEALKDWRIESISPEKVLLSGPAGNITLEPQPDANLVRHPPPVAVRPDELEPSVPSDAVLAGAPGQPTAMTPIVVGNLPIATPIPVQSYPSYLPEYYAGYDQNYPSYNYDPYPYPYFTYAVPIRVRFRFGFFHRHDVRHVAFHGGGFHGGGFHGGGFHSGRFHGGGHR